MSVASVGGQSFFSPYDSNYFNNQKTPYGEENANTNPIFGEEEDESPYDSARKKPGYKSSPEECQTCKNRKYQDGSDEMVSFKSPGHINPDNAAAVVLGHEHEHVANAYEKAERNNGEVEHVSVRLKTDICPECGRTYISGGVTNTQIKYFNEDNPYQKDMKESDAVNKYRGANVDIAA